MNKLLVVIIFITFISPAAFAQSTTPTVAATPTISEEEINKMGERILFERTGIYFCKEELVEIRLSLEGVQLLKDQITKGIFKLENDEQLEQWMTGQELLIKTGLYGVLAIKYKDDFLGCGKASENKIGNFIPKNRRLRINSKIE